MTKQLSSGPFLITTEPSITKCPDCRRLVLAVTVGGLDRHVDPTALNEVGELAALMAGRKSYELHSSTLVRRTVAMVSRERTPGVPVMATHACTAVPVAYRDDSVMDRAVALTRRLLGAQEVQPEEPDF